MVYSIFLNGKPGGKMSDPLKLINIYAPEYHHDEAYIVGNRAALESLHKRIETLLALPEIGNASDGSWLNGCDSEGEGYTVHLIRVSDEEFSKLMPHYTRPTEIDLPRNSIHPANIGKEMK